MKILVHLSFFVFLSLTAFGQKVTIYNSETNEVIPYAEVTSSDLGITKMANENGSIDLQPFYNAEHLIVLASGFNPKATSYRQLIEDGLMVRLTPSTLTLDEIVISASKFRQRSVDVAAKISKITPERLSIINPQTAADLLGVNGEVYIQKSQQAGGSPMIRGFSTHRLLYAIDGVRMNTAIFRAGNLQNIISLDPFAMESTEVLFGPGSVIYGSDAIGGVMSFQTLQAKLSSSGNLSTSGSATIRHSTANNELTAHADVSIGGSKWASVTSISHSKFGDLKMGTHGPDDYLKPYYVITENGEDKVIANPNPLVQNPTGYDQFNVLQKIRFSPNEKWDFNYAWHFSETSDYPRYDRLLETKNGLPSSAIWMYGPQKWRMHHFSVFNNASTKMYDRLAFRAAYQYFEESRIDRKLNNTRLRTQTEQVDAYSLNLDFEKRTENCNFTYGLEYVLNDVKSKGEAINVLTEAPIAVPDRYPASVWSSYAAYLSYQYQMSTRSVVEAGMRYSSYNLESNFERHLSFYPFDFKEASIHNGALSGNIGWVYKPSSRFKLAIHGGTGFRAPNVDDIGKIFDFTDGNIIVPNPDLKAEYAYNGEVNLSGLIGDVVKWDVSGFYTYLDNAMVKRAFTVDGKDSVIYNGTLSQVFAIQNAAFATVFGTNIGIEANLGAGFYAGGRYNIQKGQEELDNGDKAPSRHAAPAFGQARLGFKNDKVTLELYTNFSAGIAHEDMNPEQQAKPFLYPKDSNGNTYSPSWYTINFKSRYVITDHILISAGLENITDIRYRMYSSGLTMPGRNMVVSATVQF